MTEKQFDIAYTATGAWFFLTEYELIRNWRDDKYSLVDFIFKTGSDTEKSGTVTRVNAVLRIIENNMDKNVLEKIKESPKISKEHPDARKLAELLLKKYHQNLNESGEVK